MKELLVLTDRFIYTRKIAFAPAQRHDHPSMQYAPGRRPVVQNARFCIGNLPAVSGDLMWASIYEDPGTRAERGVGVDAKRLAARSLFPISPSRRISVGTVTLSVNVMIILLFVLIIICSLYFG